MKLTHIKGNTYVLEGEEFIPLYKTGPDTCVLLDTGLLIEREDLENTLLEHGLTPIGVLCSHAHVDHCANNGYLQEKYGAKVALTWPEAGMCSSVLTLKNYFLTLPASLVERESGCMVHRPDVIIPDTDGPFAFCGAEFGILHTPGHSAGHVAITTPDNVCYVGDALLSRDLQNAKLPYSLRHTTARESRDKLLSTRCDCYIIAHRGLCNAADFPALVRDNNDLFARRSAEILSLIDRPMTFSSIDQTVCAHYSLLTRQYRRALRFERNVRFFVEFLADEGYLDMECVEGTVYYHKVKDMV